VERKYWLAIGGALLVIGALVFGIQLAAGPDERGAHGVRDADRRDDGLRSESGIGAPSDDDPMARGSEARTRGDGGVGAQRIAVMPSRQPLPPADRALQNRVNEAEQTNGFRVGVARRRIEIIESRRRNMIQLAEGFERDGNTELAERQRSVIARFDERLEEMRGELGTLESGARSDGTIGDAQSGYDSLEEEANRAAIRGVNAPPQ
jgi:hypothetical protein